MFIPWIKKKQSGIKEQLIDIEKLVCVYGWWKLLRKDCKLEQIQKFWAMVRPYCFEWSSAYQHYILAAHCYNPLYTVIYVMWASGLVYTFHGKLACIKQRQPAIICLLMSPNRIL